MKKTLFLLSLFLAAGTAAAGEVRTNDAAQAAAPSAVSERYQSILDRMPFGQPPPGFDPNLPPGTKGNGTGGADGAGEMTAEQRTEEEQRLASSVRISMINVTPSGKTMVGFTDSTAQPLAHYYLAVGEKAADGSKWEVADADPAESKATLAKDGLSVTLALGEGNAGGDKKGGGAARRPHGLARRGGLAAAPTGAAANAAPPAAAPGGGGALARLRQRNAQQRQEEAVRRREAAEQAQQDREQREQEKAQQAAEREEQRNALLQIQEELRRQREEKTKQAAEGGTASAAEDGGSEQ